MTGKWNYQPPTQAQLLKRDELANRFGLSPALCLLMVQRGIQDDDAVQRYLNPSLNDLHDPFLYPDMQ
ncbi:MAG: single-stranded-DNA-specific exonuclease RecJ, partial [Dysgonamonadaceae bacterium]|nr:single-stranded-DNA-specific exonuclease RecJ [Dysgonamonadaceae bacterium]